jgi:hypothetical protein
MKKAILILIAGLLLSSNAYAGSIYMGMDFSKFKKNFFPTTLGWQELRLHNTYPKHMHSGTGNSMYLSRNGNEMSYGFESRTSGMKGYKLTKVFNNNLEAIEYYLSLNPTNLKMRAKLLKWKAKQSGSKADASEDKQIAKAQSTCRKLGLTPGTDKFIDCAIKMMSQAQGQSQGKSQTIIVGPPRKHPKVACDAMGGLIC